MSRYLQLLQLNLTFILAAIVSNVTQYKLKKISRQRLLIQLIMWVIILAGLASAGSIYDWLFANGLTQTDSLSLFDVVQITAIVVLFYIVNRARLKLEVIERRLNDLHQEISIRLSQK